MSNLAVQKALVNEFWLTELGQFVPVNVFAEFITHNVDPANRDISNIEIQLNPEACKRVRDLCSNSEVLIFNFYATVFCVLVNKYFNANEVCFISPLQQFKDVADNNEFCLFKSSVNKKSSFKEMFSQNKVFLNQSLTNCASIDFITQIGGIDKIKSISSFALVINDGNYYDESCRPELLFKIEERRGFYFFKVQVVGSVYNHSLLELFGYNFAKLLEEVLENLYSPVNQLDFQSEREKNLLKEFNTVTPCFSLEKNIPELFALQVQLHPHKTAINDNGKVIDYISFDLLTNRLARYLSTVYNAGADMLFGIMMDRSITMAACIMAVWKAGAAYVPIDSFYPVERIRQIAEASSLTAMLVNDEVNGELLADLSVTIPVIYFDQIQTALSVLSPEPLSVIINPADLAYVIYTSGSTGKPKGVMIEHGGMLNHIGSKIVEMGINAESVVAQNAAHTFDISVWQFFSALAIGGNTVIFDKETVPDTAAFIAKMKSDGITVLELVPSYLIEMLAILEESEQPIAFPDLKILILNAETLMPAMVKRWLALYPHIPIVNTYGATEASDDISHYIMHRCPDTFTVPVLKKPIQFFEVHIVDEDLKPVPIGTKGEILLCGPAVGRGYLNDQVKTQQSFLKGPLPGITNHARIYKTGDLGRYLPDGVMEFFGRRDNQIKIMGHRIELGEIEHAMMTIEEVEHTAVLANQEQQYMVAYYQAVRNLSAEYILGILRQKLPEYMLPHYFIQLDKFPLNQNGKIDRKALPLPEKTALYENVLYVAPRNTTEEKLVFIWQEILNKERIGVKDNFFDLGGHSIKATRLSAIIHKTLDVKLTLKDIFSNAVLEEQAQMISKAGKNAFTPIVPAAQQPYYPLSSSQKRMWIVSQLKEANVAYNMWGAFVFEGILNSKALDYAFAELIERHEALRTVFREDETGEVQQFIYSADAFDFKIRYEDLRGKNGDEAIIVKQKVHAATTWSFDLSTGPLLRAELYQVANDRWIFINVMHHIISDGWSMKILVNELLLLYNAYNNGGQSPLLPLNIQYKDYAVWQQQQLSTDTYTNDKNYWLKQFDKPLPVLNLQAGKERPVVKTYNAKTINSIIQSDLHQRFVAYTHEQGATLFMSLAAIVNVLLYTCTGQYDFIIGTPVSGREHVDLENQIGLYLNTIALRTKFSEEETCHQLFSQVKQITVDAFEHQMYPFDDLVDALRLQRDLSRNALFDVWIVLHNIESYSKIKAQHLSGLNVTPYEGEQSALTKFDLLFNFFETSDQLHINMEYNTDIISEKYAAIINARFEKIIELIVDDPAVRLAEIKTNVNRTEKEAQKTGIKLLRRKNLENLKNKSL